MNSLRVILFALFAAACSSAVAQQPYTIVAVVDGVPISSSEVEQNIREREQMIHYQYHNDQARINKELALVREGAIENLIDREILLAEFRKMGGVIRARHIDDQVNAIIREVFKGNRDAFVDELAKTGTTMKKYREDQEKMFIQNAMRQNHKGDHPPPTPREVQEYYDQNVDKWREGDQIKISTITIPKFTGESGSTPEKQRQLAQELRTKIVQGADFARIAKTNSKDSHSDKGGSWDWMAKTDLMPAIANAAMALKTGGVSQVLDLENNYIIVACDAKKLGEAPDIEKLRPEIEKMIYQEKAKANIDTWMDSVRKKHVIRRLDTPATPTTAPTATPTATPTAP